MAKGVVHVEEVVGLKDFMRELRQFPERADLDIRKGFRDIAKDIREDARSRAENARPLRGKSERPSPPVQHWKDLVNTIRSGSTSEAPYVAVGAPKVPWALGYEFGSNRFRQFPAWKGRGAGAGYFFWPAVDAANETVLERMGDAIDAALAAAYPESGGIA